MPAKKLKKNNQPHWPALSQIERVIFRTMRIEEPNMTKSVARKAAAKVRLRKT